MRAVAQAFANPQKQSIFIERFKQQKFGILKYYIENETDTFNFNFMLFLISTN